VRTDLLHLLAQPDLVSRCSYYLSLSKQHLSRFPPIGFNRAQKTSRFVTDIHVTQLRYLLNRLLIGGDLVGSASVLGVLFREYETRVCPEWLLDASLEFGRQQAGRGEGNKTLRFYKTMLRTLEEHEKKILMGRKRRKTELAQTMAAAAASAAKVSAVGDIQAASAMDADKTLFGSADGETPAVSPANSDSTAASRVAANTAAANTATAKAAAVTAAAEVAAGDKIRGNLRVRILMEMVAVQMNQGQVIGA
jgi:hypothetical protein